MTAFGFLTRAVFGLEITENNGVIRISGIRAHQFIQDINKTFGTTRVTIHMLNKATRTYVEFYSFFAIDIEYIIRQLAQQKSSQLGRRGYIKMQEALIANTWLSGLDKIHPSIFNKSKLKEIKFDLLKHQAEFIDYYDRVLPRYNLRGILMAATPGSGKTISAIAISCAYEAKNIIVVCPKNAVFRVWEKTLLEDMNVEQTVWCQASKKPMPDTTKNRWYIFHYEALGEAVALASKLSNTRCVIVLDESHNMNEMKSLRTERFVSMCRGMKDSIIVELSGTPMKAMGAEAIPLISAIDPLFNDKCVEKFKKIYGREAKAATAILANRLGIIMYKVNKEESKIEEPVEHSLKVTVPNAEQFTLEAIKKDMKAFIEERIVYYKNARKTYESIYYGALKEFENNKIVFLANKEGYETYKTYIKEFVKHGYNPTTSAPKALYCNDFEKRIIEPAIDKKNRKDFRSAKSVVKYVNLKIRGECLGTVLSRARMNCNMAILKSLDLASLIDGAEKKTLVFTSYVEVVKATSIKLKEQGYNPLSVFAETNAQLPQMVKQFGEDESINPMIATYQSLSTAVPLIMANRVVLLNSPFRIHEKEQTVARANRIGQDKTVHVYNVLLDTGDTPNISTRSSDIMEWSREQVNAIMGFDNDKSDISIESLQEGECLVDMSTLAVDNDYIEEEVMSIESREENMRFIGQGDGDCDCDNLSDLVIEDAPYTQGNITGDAMSLSHVSIENRMDNLFNDINTTTNYILKVTSDLDNGITPTVTSLEVYHLINKSEVNLGLESNLGTMARTVLSLEQEGKRATGILTRLLDFLVTLFDTLMEYINDVGRQQTSNIERCAQLKKYITSSNNAAFTTTERLEITGSSWLTRGKDINPINHIADMKWQYNANTKIIGLLNRDFATLGREFNKNLDDIVSRPDTNLMQPIMKRLNGLSALLVESTTKNNETNNIVYSAGMLGGRQIMIRYPKKASPDEMLKNHSIFQLKTKTIDNFNIDQARDISPMNRGQCLDLIDIITDNNKQLSYVNTVLNGVHTDVKRFVKSARRIEKAQAGQINDAQSSKLTAQVSIMVSGLKGLASFCREFARINDKSSKASIRYMTESARGPVIKQDD